MAAVNRVRVREKQGGRVRKCHEHGGRTRFLQREHLDGDVGNPVEAMVVGEKAIAAANGGAGEVKGIGNPEGVSCPEVCRGIPDGGVGFNKLHALCPEKAVVSVQEKLVAVSQRLHAALQAIEVGHHDGVRPGARACGRTTILSRRAGAPSIK